MSKHFRKEAMSNFRGYSNSLATAYGVASFQTGSTAPKTRRRKAVTPVRHRIRLVLHRLITSVSNLVSARVNQDVTDSYLEDTDLEKDGPADKTNVPFLPPLAA